MMLTGIAGVAICYLTSFAVATTESAPKQATTVLSSALTLPEALRIFHKLVSMEEDRINGMLKSKFPDNAAGIYSKLQDISNLMKTKCTFVDNTVQSSGLDINDADALVGMIEDSVNLIEGKMNLLRDISARISNDHFYLSNWLMEVGIVSTVSDIKTPLTTDILKRCYTPFLRDCGFYQLKQLLAGEKVNIIIGEEGGESDHEHCDHQEQHCNANAGTAGNQGAATTPSTGNVSSPGAQPVSTPTQEVTQPASTVNSDAQTAPSAPAQAQGNNLTQAPEQKAGASQSGFNALAIGAMSVMLLSVF